MADSSSATIKNLESAFGGESMAHIKYRYFAKLCRAAGDEATAKIFEETANQEVMHAFGHLDLLYPAAEMTPARCLQMALDGETYEFTEMYPSFHQAAVAEAQQAGGSKAILEKAAKRFAALAKVEEKHANHYQATLAALTK